MLILSRKCGESIVINGEIEILVTEISGDKIKIGITAPQNYRVLRKELCQTVESNRESAGGAITDGLLDFISRLK